MIKAIIFDCFGVLYTDPGLGFYEREVKDFARLRRDILDIDKQFDYGIISDVEHDKLISELTGLSYDFVHENVRGEHVRNQRLLEYSQKLRLQYKVGMLSNIGTNGMWSFFSKEECRQYFDSVLLSSDVGIVKPSREIYEIIAERLGVAPNECVMVDDRQANIDGAYSAGMQGVLFETTNQTIADIAALLTQEQHA